MDKELEEEMEEKEVKREKFYKNDIFALISFLWCIVFIVIQFTIMILAGPETDLINVNNLEIITMIIVAFLILLLFPKLLKITNEKITSTLSNFNIKPNILESKIEIRKKMKKWRVIAYSAYAIILSLVLAIDYFNAFKGTELSFEEELRNVLSEVLLTTELNLSLGIILYSLYILMFILFYAYVLIMMDVFFTKLNAFIIPLILANNKELDIFNSDNSMGFGELGDIGKIIIFSSSTIIVICLPQVFLTYLNKLPSSSILDIFIIFIFISALGWMFYIYQMLKPIHMKMKDSKKKMMDKIVQEIDKESKKFIYSKTSTQRKSVQTKKLEIFLELRKQLINVRIWPISSTVIIVLISQSIALVIAIVSWLIGIFGLL